MILIFIMMYFLSFFFVVNSDDWFLVWMGMEINMLSFIFLIYSRWSMVDIESCLKYFFIQSVGSSLFMSLFYFNKFEFMYLSSIILMYKMGGGPFYFWFPSICNGMGWWACFFLMTFQKLIPLLLMVSLIGLMIWVLMVISLVLGALGSFNQQMIKRLLAFSSVHHIGWMLVCMMIESNLWLLYLMLYVMMIFPVILYMYKYEVNSIMELIKFDKKCMFMLMFFSMGGMPPFLGFFMKWMVFYYLLQVNLILVLLMVFLSVIMFYVYIRVVYDFMMGFKNEYSWVKKNVLSNNFMIPDFFSLFGVLLGCIFGVIYIV